MTRAPKACPRPGCSGIVAPGGRCSRCAPSSPAPRRFGTASNPTKRTADAGHKRRRLEVLKAAGYLCQINHPTKCKRNVGLNGGVLDHKIGLSLRDLIPAEIRPSLVEMNTGRWNLQAACVPCSRWKTSMEGHWVQGHTVDWSPDFTIIPPHARPGGRGSTATGGTPRPIIMAYNNTDSAASSTSDASSTNDALTVKPEPPSDTPQQFESWDPRSDWY